MRKSKCWVTFIVIGKYFGRSLLAMSSVDMQFLFAFAISVFLVARDNTA